jgi:Domain of unknown function (DUF4440)
MRGIVLLALVATCASGALADAGGPVKPAEAATIRVEIEARVRAMAAGAAAGDVEKTFADASMSPDFRMADSGSVYVDRDATLGAFKRDFLLLRSQDIRLTEQLVAVVSREVAMSTTRGVVSATYKSGTVIRDTPFVWTVLWTREGGRWR